ncbi:hypothetical protein ACFU99_08990 [Streptomyces sp. NPDC057654]|uniref:hypothetical protein n=1 Tax=Streptomyces sp. NPDC057654 TaxID=3346196 RepID=UPI003680DD7A
MITELLKTYQSRRHTLPGLIQEADQPRTRASKGHPPVTAVLVTRRLLSGFGTAMEENAAIVSALRHGGHPAQLVVGAEPVPADDGEYPVFTWITVDGLPLDPFRPPDTFLVELARYPEHP